MTMKGGRQVSHAIRVAADRALKEVYGKGGIEGLTRVWCDILDRDGPRVFMDVLAKYVPRELDIQEEDGVIHIVGKIPTDPLQWAKEQGLPAPIVVEGEAGEEPKH